MLAFSSRYASDGLSTAALSGLLFVILTTIALILGLAQSCTTNSSASRSSGPPKNGQNMCRALPVPVPAGSMNNATSVLLSANTLHTNCEWITAADLPVCFDPPKRASNRFSSVFGPCRSSFVLPKLEDGDSHGKRRS
jgi:hypothetical protein